MMAFKNFAKFEGRSSRSEYWYFALFNFLISIALAMLPFFAGKMFAGVSGLYGLLVFIPTIALSIRRLHDTNRSGWWFLINFLPFIGWIIFIIFAIQASDAGDNQYGPNPQGAVSPQPETVSTPPTTTQ